MSKQQTPFEEDISKRIRQHADDVAPEVASRLQQMRREVLRATEANNTNPGILRNIQPWLVPASAVAGLLVTSLVIHNMNSENELNIMDDLAILTEAESFEFYQNMDFYQWLEESEKNG